jgi:hypothetical protein
MMPSKCVHRVAPAVTAVLYFPNFEVLPPENLASVGPLATCGAALIRRGSMA